MPVFLSITKDLDNRERARILKKAVVISVIILLCFTFAGQVLFTLFGISANGFRVAAGIIILKIGFDMLQAKYSNAKFKEDELHDYAEDICITPLAIPMLCGPGAIANGIMLMGDADSLSLKATVVGSIIFIYLLTYVILRASTRLVPLIGKTGNNVMMRLMGLILMVIAVECFFSGLKPIIVDMIKAGTGC